MYKSMSRSTGAEEWLRREEDEVKNTRRLKLSISLSDIQQAKPMANSSMLLDGQGRNIAKIGDELRRIFKDNELCLVFRDFLRKNQCEENLFFWIHVELFKDEIETQDVETYSQSIWRKFLKEGAKHEINVDCTVKDSIALGLQKKPISRQVFSEAQSIVWNLMENDCIMKFIDSPLYAQWKEKNFSQVLQSFEQDPKSKKMGRRTLRGASKLFAKKPTTQKNLSEESLNLEKFFEILQARTDKKAGSDNTNACNTIPPSTRTTRRPSLSRLSFPLSNPTSNS